MMRVASIRTMSFNFVIDFSARNTPNCPTPAYADGYVFWANGYGRGGVCLKLTSDGDAITAEVAWTTKDMDCHHGGYVIHEGYIYGNDGGGHVIGEHVKP